MITLHDYLMIKALVQIHKRLQYYVNDIVDSDEYRGVITLSNDNHIRYTFIESIRVIDDYLLAVDKIEYNSNTDTIELSYTSNALEYAFSTEENLNYILENEKISFSELELSGYKLSITCNNSNEDEKCRLALKEKGYTWAEGQDLATLTYWNSDTSVMCYSLERQGKKVAYTSSNVNPSFLFQNIDFELEDKHDIQVRQSDICDEIALKLLEKIRQSVKA